MRRTLPFGPPQKENASVLPKFNTGATEKILNCWGKHASHGVMIEQQYKLSLHLLCTLGAQRHALVATLYVDHIASLRTASHPTVRYHLVR